MNKKRIEQGFLFLALILLISMFANFKGYDANIAPTSGWATYENYPRPFTSIVHFDSDVQYNGLDSIRIEPHTGGDSNVARECDALNGEIINWVGGNNVILNCCIKTTTSQNSENDNNPEAAALV